MKKANNDKEVTDLDEASAQLSDIQISPENDLQFLKNCVLKNVNRNVLLSKLKSTQKHRETLMLDENLDLRTSFPFFFAEPHLVFILNNISRQFFSSIFEIYCEFLSD